MFDYMTVEEAAVKWDVSIQQVRGLCRKGEIPGTLKKGTMWFIPSQAEHPAKRSRSLYQFPGTKKKIFETSIKLFAARSFGAITLKDIADATGIAQSAVYRHFKSKQEILDNVYGYFKHYYLADRPSIEDLEPVIRGGSLKDIFECVYYDFSPEHVELVVDCTRIIFQRMSFDEQAAEIFKDLILKSGLDFAEQVFTKAIEAGRIPKTDTLSLSVFSNMTRQTILLNWLANNADPVINQRLKQCQDTLTEMLIKALTAGENCGC